MTSFRRNAGAGPAPRYEQLTITPWRDIRAVFRRLLRTSAPCESRREFWGPKSEVQGLRSEVRTCSSSAVMKNSSAEASYWARSTFGLQQTWQSST